MNPKLFNKFLTIVLVYIFSQTQVFAMTKYDTSAAVQFAKSFSQNENLSLVEINNYLSIDSYGLKALSNRIRNPESLKNAIDNNKQEYQHAINVCLPVAMQLSEDANKIISKSALFLLGSNNVSIDIVFGANNTAATATPHGIILALEGICKGVSSAHEAKTILLEYIAHEVVHVYQYRNSKRTNFNFTLLEISLIEGTADYFSEIAMQKSGLLQRKREQYGAQHEKDIWTEFSKVMHGNNYLPWLYSKPKNNMPPDMGYWVGKSIIKKLYEQTPNKKQVKEDILILQDAKKILKASMYQQPL